MCSGDEPAGYIRLSCFSSLALYNQFYQKKHYERKHNLKRRFKYTFDEDNITLGTRKIFGTENPFAIDDPFPLHVSGKISLKGYNNSPCVQDDIPNQISPNEVKNFRQLIVTGDQEKIDGYLHNRITRFCDETRENIIITLRDIYDNEK